MSLPLLGGEAEARASRCVGGMRAGPHTCPTRALLDELGGPVVRGRVRRLAASLAALPHACAAAQARRSLAAARSPRRRQRQRSPPPRWRAVKPPLSLPAASSAGGGRASNDRISRTIEERAASAPVQLPRSLSKPARSLSIGGAARRPGARRRRRGEPAGWAVRPGSHLGVPESARLFCPRGDRGQFDQAAPLHLDCIPAARSPPHRRVPPPLSGGQRSGSSSLSQSYRRSSSHGHVSLLLGASPAASGGGSVPPTLLGAAGGATSCGLLQQCRAAGAASPDPPTRRHASLVPSAAAAPPVTACAVAIAQMRHPCSPTGARDDTYTAGPTCVAAAIHCIRSPRVHATRRIHCTRLTPSVAPRVACHRSPYRATRRAGQARAAPRAPLPPGAFVSLLAAVL